MQTQTGNKPNTTVILNNLLTTSGVCRLFGVKQMTIWNWRHRTDDPLPCIIIPGDDRHNIRFDMGTMLQWAKRNGKRTPGSRRMLESMAKAGNPVSYKYDT